jgi:aspartyl-tRNA(Asn)/glutamyl-tRNA(Gln) amidotransferase subunit B
VGQEKFGTRAEIKNLNSFRFVERAINFEIERQIDLIESGGSVIQETRLYDANKDETRSMRSKEEANDYRYFPDPDLLPLEITSAAIEEIRTQLPELPDEKKARFAKDYGLSEYDAGVLTATRELASYFETVVAISACDPKLCANWVMGDLAAALNKAGLEIDASPVEAERLAGLLQRIADDTISGKIAKQVFEALWESDATADTIIDQQGLRQITDTGAIEGIIDEILAANPEQVEGYRGGKDKLFGFFVGQAMKATGGKANPAQLNDLLKKKLNG